MSRFCKNYPRIKGFSALDLLMGWPGWVDAAKVNPSKPKKAVKKKED